MKTARLILACCALSIPTAFAPASAADSAPQPLALDKPLIAYWTFDEVLGARCRDSSGNHFDAAPENPAAGGLRRVPGLFGAAMSFSGSHMLRVPGKPDFNGLSALSFSVWVLPTEMGRYSEIFRKEDGDSRVLFSFQDNCTHLSLGLNIGGYVECHASITPAQVLDGRWHHCAATFDGQFMRVYLDGKEIGSLKRPGTISAGGPAPGCIGSSSGGENFQGIMDELRIYKATLTPEEIARLYDDGVKALAAQSGQAVADEPSLDRGILAHWTFNESALSPVIVNSTGNTAFDVKPASPVLRTRGVHGNALALMGTHSLPTTGGFGIGELQAISFSAWARPTDLSGFREIFRKEDGDRRVLFSFQENGTDLSLGLDINGYVECRAPIDPARVLDGQWHHCAATFDGQDMRVYLDGKQIGTLKRPGKVITDPNSSGFIGSSSGGSEHFQGALDDLRIYKVALTPAEIATLHDAGAASIDRIARQFSDQLKLVFTPGQPFAATLADMRRKLTSGEARLSIDLVGLLTGKLTAAFPDECARFASWAGASPIEYAAAGDDQLQIDSAERLVGLALEYQPLTPYQKAKETPEDAKRWREAEALQAQLEALKARGEAARFSPEWIDLMLKAGGMVQFRPYQSEAVAPYVKPETPVTRDLSASEARAALERDWLHQADGNPTPERIRQEIKWARQLADRIEAAYPDRVNLSPQRTKLDKLEKGLGAGSPDARALYFAVREAKRAILFANPVVDFDKVLLVDMPYPAGSEWPHETRHRLGYMAVPGARLMTLTGLSPAGHLTQLMPQAPLHGSFWRPDLSFDGTKIVFCFKPHNEKSFHLYEINIDGSGLRQLTDGPYDDLDPIYLPDGKHIAFSTTRGHTYVRCMPPTNAFVLARCDRDGHDIYLISCNNEPDYLPSVMDDGRIIYTRWEYTDKPLWRDQALWTVNPDGTAASTYWGNQSVWPDLLKDARCIPGSNRVMFTGSAHHNWFGGSVGIVDRGKGINFPDGVTKVTADVAWPEVGNGPVDPIESPNYHRSGQYEAYYSPYPLSDRDFLVSANRGGKFVLYLMDTDGNRELIYEGVNNIFHAMPLKARPTPPVIPDTVAWPDREHRLQPQDGLFFSANVYQGAPQQLKDKAKYLRVMAIEPKTYTYWYKRPYISTGPVVSMVQSDGVKRCLGTVPIDSDGSVAFRAPAGRALHFQLLDGNMRVLQTMRSFAGLMPGEKRGCLGCHEQHSGAPAFYGTAQALRKPPQSITPPPWGLDSVSYPRYVQPVLDRYCAKCHEGNGQARKTLDLTMRPGFLDFNEPYVTLTGSPTWAQAYSPPSNPPPGFGIANTIMVEGYSTTDPKAYTTPEPMTRLSYRSQLIDIAASGKHHGVKVDPVSLQRLIVWVDAMCPYFGAEEIRQLPDPEFQGVDWLAIRPKIATAPTIVRPGPMD
jgi:hypothetical protein